MRSDVKREENHDTDAYLEVLETKNIRAAVNATGTISRSTVMSNFGVALFPTSYFKMNPLE